MGTAFRLKLNKNKNKRLTAHCLRPANIKICFEGNQQLFGQTNVIVPENWIQFGSEELKIC